jgi:hypothetical protein
MIRDVYCGTDWNLCSRCVLMKMKENGWAFYFKTPCKKYLDKKMTKTKDIIP